MNERFSADEKAALKTALCSALQHHDEAQSGEISDPPFPRKEVKIMEQLWLEVTGCSWRDFARE